MTTTRSTTAVQRAIAALGLACLYVLGGQVVARELAVGQVSLMIGEARVVHTDGSIEALKRGASILVGDRIETTANGHVHVRFIDNAAVSVRPESVLEVQSYQYDAQRPQANEVRLRVEQGTGRSISGAATEHDKNRFRLNTPIAAIGVRGTDFIVQTDASGVRATVADGAIIVGALGAGCSAAALGPCGGSHASVLSADMGRLMIEIRRGEDVARLVPVAGAIIAAASLNAEERMAAQKAADAAARAGGIAATEAFRSNNDRAAADVLTIAEAATPSLNSRPDDKKAQLVWGRYSPALAFNDNVSFAASRAGVGRSFTVGDADFTLFRTTDPANPGQLLQTNARDVSLRLSRGQATFEAGGRVEAASIDGGTLTLDFSRRTFATGLLLSSPTAGRTELRVAGDVSPTGTFTVADGSTAASRQYLSGAVSLDGKEAGYLFERGTIGGLFKGKTLWGH